eukprot:10393475-Karenia_brevis.AAC.1
MLVNIREVVSTFRKERAKSAKLCKPRAPVIFQLLNEVQPQAPWPLYATYKSIVGGQYEWEDLVINAEHSEQELLENKCYIMLLALCGFLNIEKDMFRPRTFMSNE